MSQVYLPADEVHSLFLAYLQHSHRAKEDPSQPGSKERFRAFRMTILDNLADQDGNKIDPASAGMSPDFPQDLLNSVTFKDLGDGRTELTVKEYDWKPGQMMELSKLGMQQCLDKMAAIFAK